MGRRAAQWVGEGGDCLAAPCALLARGQGMPRPRAQLPHTRSAFLPGSSPPSRVPSQDSRGWNHRTTPLAGCPAERGKASAGPQAPSHAAPFLRCSVSCCGADSAGWRSGPDTPSWAALGLTRARRRPGAPSLSRRPPEGRSQCAVAAGRWPTGGRWARYFPVWPRLCFYLESSCIQQVSTGSRD